MLAEARFPPWAVPAAVLLTGTLIGSLVVLAEIQAVIIYISVLASILVLQDYRLGIIALVVMMPLSASSQFPHSMGGIVGLNPMNLVLLGTIASCVLNGHSLATLRRVTPRPLIWLYIVPLVVTGLIGTRYVADIPADVLNSEVIAFDDIAGYIKLMVVRPLFLVVFALLVATAVAESGRSEGFIKTMIASVLVMSLLTISFVTLSGADIHQLGGDMARGFLSPLGIHANDLGRLYSVAAALLLFTAVATTRPGLKAALIVALGILVVALILTFSRSAFGGLLLVILWFLVSRRQLNTLLLGLIVLAALALLLPDAVFERILYGWDASPDAANAITAGRLDGLWMPLLPEFWQHPLVGSGLGSIIWSDAMRAGSIRITTHPHNAYLELALDMGLMGLILIPAYFVHVWKGFASLGTNSSLSPEERGFYTGGAVGLAVFLLTAVTGSSLQPTPEQSFLWLAIGMMYGTQYRQRQIASGPA